MSEPSQADAEPTRPISDSNRSGDAPADTPSVRRGDPIGRYLVVDRLGSGGMGEVVAAYDPELDRRVAIKLVRLGSRSRTNRARERMVREAQALAKLSHPNVVTVYDAGPHGKGVFIAMEYIEGRTLQQWLDAKTRPWREVLDVLLHAGQGLAAAHAAGLVHRDFKPANVMVGDDGRVRVLDFGLARRADDADEPDPDESLGDLEDLSRSSSRPVTSLTETGVVLGTPAYMAPEQFVRGTIDARTDQFAFCIVAWRALFGVAPFTGRSFEDLGHTVRRGIIAEPPRTTGVPRVVKDVLRQGLSKSADERFETMDVLIAKLRRAAGGGRRPLAVASLAAVALVGASGLLWLGSEDTAPCEGLQAHLKGVWDAPRREEMAAAFRRTEAAFAEDARVGVTGVLDGYAESWVRMREESCVATRVHGDQTESLMDLRNACLDSRRRELEALVDVLVAANAGVVERSVDAAQRLPSLDACADTERLLADVKPPTDPEMAAEVERIRDELADARAYAFAGALGEALTVIEPLMERARALDYPPVVAEAANVAGLVHQHRGEVEAAANAYEDALEAAEQSGHGRAEAEALLGLGSVYGTIGTDPVRALRNIRHARAVLVRIGEPPELVASAWLYAGNAHVVAHDYDEAENDFARTLAVVADLPGAGRLELAALSNLASSRGTRGEYRAAAAAFQDAIDVAEGRLGEHHPIVATLYNNVGATFARAGHAEDAITALSRALAIYDETIGRMHPETARALQNRGVAWSWLGEDARAEEDFERARDIKLAVLDPNDATIAGVEANLADLKVRSGRPLEARRHAEQSLRVLSAKLGNEHPQTVYAHVSLALALLALGEVEAARAEIEVGLKIAKDNELDPFERARLRFAAARVLWESDDDPKRALAFARDALADYRSPERKSDREIEEIEQWLAKHH